MPMILCFANNKNEKICRQLLELILHVKVGEIKFLTSQHEIEIDPQSKKEKFL